MPYFQVDDCMPFHRKVLRAGNEAIGAWVRAGAWSSSPANLTEGWIPAEVCASIAPPRVWAKLRAAGLTEEPSGGRGGEQLHDFTAYNPTADSVREKRKAWAQKKANQRAKQTLSPGDIPGDTGGDAPEDSRGSPDAPIPCPCPCPTDPEIPPNPPQAGGAGGDGSSGGRVSATLSGLTLTARETAVASALADDRSLAPIAGDIPTLAVKLCATYPGIDIVREIGIAGDWMRKNPKKPKKNADRFLREFLKDKDPSADWTVRTYLAGLKRFQRVDRAAQDADRKAAGKVVKEAMTQAEHRASRGGDGFIPTWRDIAAHWIKNYLTADDMRLAEQGYPLAFMLTRVNLGDLPKRPMRAEPVNGNGEADAHAGPRNDPPPATAEELAKIQQEFGGIGEGFNVGNGPTDRPRFT